jgi:hypothetical protein
MPHMNEDHPLLGAIESRIPKTPRFLTVDQTFPEWTVGEMYEGTIRFRLVAQDMHTSRFEVTEFNAADEESTMPDMAKRRPVINIVPSPSE